MFLPCVFLPVPFSTCFWIFWIFFVSSVFEVFPCVFESCPARLFVPFCPA
uniref:Uncharacterized protein n=1 Tax=Anguilla anguilla TaxID=7936 RepID=A0A0E9XV17_ANGAN